MVNLSLPVVVGFGGALSLWLLYRLMIRLRLSLAKHPSLRGHARWSRRIVGQIPALSYNACAFYTSDDAPAEVVRQRRSGMQRLRDEFRARMPRTLDFSESLEESISDVQFTSRYRVPFPYREQLPAEFRYASVLDASNGVCVRNLDGRWSYDLSGSYGVNVFGYEVYKQLLARGMERVAELGPVLGAYHPVIRDNVERLKAISGLDEVSFHMSGTEAVMQAVRLARYHTGRSHLVRFCGAYHGWWDGVQPGVGNRRKVDDVYTLADLSEASIRVLETRNDIACILINPFQALHPNSDAASDASLISSTRTIRFDRAAYTAWLQRLRQICDRRGIVMIMDEVFAGFRLGYRGAQEYFDVQADLVTYGKTLGGGLPIGVVCGRRRLMKRFKPDRPADISFARGTFNSHPWVMAAMNEFLHYIDRPEVRALYGRIEETWTRRVERLNQQLASEDLPIRFGQMHTVLTILYTRPSRYNWMLQFYLRNEGLELSWIGTGRMIMSFDISDEDFAGISEAVLRAARRMAQDGWWWDAPGLTNKAISRRLLRELLGARFPWLGSLLGPAAPPCPSIVPKDA